MLQPNKACPVVLRPMAVDDFEAIQKIGCGSTGYSYLSDLHRDFQDLSILSFVHPKAGKQIIKGTIEPGEDATAAALRELGEESGITDATAIRSLGIWQSGFPGQIWSFTLCVPTAPLAEQWTHYTTDGGGHIFSFFWQPLTAPLSEAWHPVFVGAINFIRARLRG